MKLVIATGNKGKLAEFYELLSGLPFDVLSLGDYPEIREIQETATSFRENAAIKAETVAKATGELALADDSGLEVDALGGRPGVYSARFAGVGAGDAANIEKLLSEIKDVPAERRTARFRAVIAIAGPGRITEFAEGTCEGQILFSPRGAGGFGYDPIFLVPETGKTFAEMEKEEKNKLSHRGKAMARVQSILRIFAEGR